MHKVLILVTTMENKVIIAVFFSISVIFSFGYLFELINAYYLFKYYIFLKQNRIDLIARLVFLSNSIGFIFYPFVLFPISLFIHLIGKKLKLKTKSGLWIGFLLGITLVGILFYTRIMNNLVYGSWSAILFGFFLIVFSIILMMGVIFNIKRTSGASMEQSN